MIAGIMAGGSKWSPKTLNPAIWMYDGSFIDAPGGKLIYWDDDANSGNGFSQVVEEYRPLLIENAINGRRVVRFDGIDDRIGNVFPNFMRNVAAGSTFAVYRRRGSSQTRRRLLSLVHSYPLDWYARFGALVSENSVANASPWLQAEGVGGGAEINLYPTSPDDQTAWGMHWISRNFAAGNAQLYSNGAIKGEITGQPAANSTDVPNTEPVYIGCYNFRDYFGEFADVDLACILVFSGVALTSDGRQKLEGWAAWRYGLQGNLPAGHPYKDAPP